MLKNINTSTPYLELWHGVMGLIILCIVFTMIKINKKRFEL